MRCADMDDGARLGFLSSLGQKLDAFLVFAYFQIDLDIIPLV